MGGQGLDGRGVGGVQLLDGPDARGVAGGGVERHGLGVGGVVAVRAVDEGVLAGGGRGQELLGGGAAHGAGDRGDDAVVQAEPLEDPDVGGAVQLVRLDQALVGGVEGVRVLHLELAAAQHTGAGAGLVAVLRLDLVQDDRQVLVGRAHVLDDLGEDLLVRGAEEVVRALTVLEAEQQVAVLVVPAAGLVGVLGQERGEQDLLAADRVHLLADDADDVLQDLLAERQPGPDSGGGASYVAGSDEELVVERLGVRRVVAQCLDHQSGHALDLGHGELLLGRVMGPRLAGRPVRAEIHSLTYGAVAGVLPSPRTAWGHWGRRPGGPGPGSRASGTGRVPGCPCRWRRGSSGAPGRRR